MATRPVYVPNVSSDIPEVIVKSVDFKWFPGMAKSQKQKSIDSLHEAASQLRIAPILEISSKSKVDLGIRLSAFNLMIKTKISNRSFSVESAFHSSKVFERGGPFVDLLEQSSRRAKKDMRLRESGSLVRFEFFSKIFPLEPRTFFYDWLYINALNQHKDLADKMIEYRGFTDIEFNPKKSLNCQAYSAALYASLQATGRLSDALESPDSFSDILRVEYSKRDKTFGIQNSLL